MIKLNLLPPIEKRNYKTEITRRFVVFFSIGTFIILSLFIGLLSFNYLFLSLQLEPAIHQLAVEKETEKAKKIMDLEKQIKETNKQIILLTNIQKQSDLMMPPIERIATDSKSGNSYLTNIQINKTDGVGGVKGFSLTRDRVINIQNNLKNNRLLSDINAPYSNFLKQSNIEFAFTFKLTPKQ